MKRLSSIRVLGILCALQTMAQAEEARLDFGGDYYAAGQTTTIAGPVEHDVFAAGTDVTLTGPVAGDAHLAGFQVDVEADVNGDLYAAGYKVNLTAAVGGDLTAAGNSVTVGSTAPVTGNVRLAGANIVLAAPVAGSALITAQSLNLDVPIAGDLSFYGENLTFGPGARVDGMLDIRAPEEITVPASVASADRVRFKRLERPDYVSEASRTAGTVVGRFWPTVWAVATVWLVLVIIGAAFIALLPRAVEALRIAAEKRPFRNLGLGILAFAAVLGLVPVMAMTVIGILLVPFVLIFVVIACALAYLAGAYLIGQRIAGAFVSIDTNLKRLGVLAIALVAAGLLGMIPVLGWLLTLLIVIFGFGVASVVIMVRWTARDVGRLTPATA